MTKKFLRSFAQLFVKTYSSAEKLYQTRDESVYITLWKYEVTAMRSSVRRLTFKKVPRPLALLAALRPKMPVPQTDSTACTMFILTNSW